MADGPRYLRIADLLREEIRSGTWKPGDRLPSHTELAAQMRVSITTARNAIQVLVAENLLYTATSRGTIVRSQEVLESVVTTHIRLDRPKSAQDIFSEIARAAGREPAKQFSARMEPASAEVAMWLGVPKDSWVVSRTVVQYLDNEPWSWEISFYPRDLAEVTGIDSPHDIPEGTTRRLVERGYAETAHRDTIVARPATAEEAAVLGVGIGTMLLDHLRIGATAERITRVTRHRSTAARNRLAYELGEDAGTDIIRRVLGAPHPPGNSHSFGNSLVPGPP
ncbi:GntR family transcriptional regulator [Nocardia terpenica]|uniref:GntR family transcriptional regulator n=1 Tax=Nocardia terpenica TaxID=455432 RepID=A0A164I8F9_9NOCA|nr:GntR family transcriptional regulator [Nocardia terpenica]ATL65765.1 GntR family transcriptional regulator [Nocardia terpenica]KZM69194.1 GntR family transcriptional regulator [Nocardia terpenica]MBF6061713.1 GntR family transcriptional regulator [Nocardia terpenica]MBF6107492.1 GntR family transcriptional regulator [Nocardia terpenica]MBF6110133.1 GntR family transcriptional regulator [Nocardia terpenica]